MLSKGWKFYTIQQCCDFLSGGTPLKDEARFWNGNIPWFSAKDLKTFLLHDSSDHITEDGLKNGTRLAPKGAILILVRGMMLNRDIPLGVLMQQSAFNQDIKALIPKPNIDEYFLAYSIVSQKKQILGLVNRSSHGTGKIETVELRSFKIPIPPLPEQQKIAAILSTWDKAIEWTQSLIDAKEEQKRGLMQRLLTGKVRVKGFENKPGFYESKIGRIPKDWKVCKASEVFRSVSTKNNKGLPLLAVTQENGVIPRDMLEGRVTMPSGSTDSYKLVVPGNFVISLRSFQGGLEYSDYKGIVSPAYTVLSNKVPIDKAFFRFFFKSQEFISRLAVAVIGIRDGKQISFEDFSSMVFRYPPVEEQTTIGNILSLAESELALLNNRLEILKHQKKGLMQQLLTGKTRVKV
jgi:type I restriction enzyme S subunit